MSAVFDEKSRQQHYEGRRHYASAHIGVGPATHIEQRQLKGFRFLKETAQDCCLRCVLDI
jgi:hypothetical protein